MKKKYYLTNGSKKIVYWSLKVLLAVTLLGLCSRIYLSRAYKYLLPSISGTGLPYMSYGISMPVDAGANLPSPSTAEKNIRDILDKVERLAGNGF